MKLISLSLLLNLLLLPFALNATTLQDIYNTAQPALGYDRLIILERHSIYTGGLSITDESIGIKGNGAIIDLQGGNIMVTGTSVIEIDRSIIINGSSGLFAQDEVTARITHCTFYHNDIGIHFMSESGMIEVVNTILANNFMYGFACEENSRRILHYIDAYQNLLGNYVEWCST